MSTTHIIRIDPHRPSLSALREAVAVLRAGGLVVYPTETAYGLAADAGNASAVRAIFTLKGRAQGKALPLIVGSVASVRAIAHLNSIATTLAGRHWPGALTLVLPVLPHAKLARGVTNRGTVAIRVSDHPVARRLANLLGKPIVSTSANQSGNKVCYSVRAFLHQRKAESKGLCILDAGALPHRAPSTLAFVTDAGVNVIRQGSIRL